MNVAQLALFLIPVGVYASLRRLRRPGDSWAVIRSKLGLELGNRKAYVRALGLGLLAVAGTWIAIHTIPAAALHDSRTTTAQSSHLLLSPLTVALVASQQLLLVAFGEELFFRGFLGGWFVRRLGFQVGNALQASVFLLPHLVLLLVSLAFWPLVVAQWVVAWVNGWLRVESRSIGPGILVHTVANTAALILAI